ncbi:hypothetical protein AAVH_02258 [Aphelenchoides avenae]|nr:hypothetical protein AAVH_02258 [Aphelenchus avenae]
MRCLRCNFLSARIALTTGSFAFNVPIGDKQWTSASREVVIIGQKSGMGLGIFDECNGACSADCVGVTLADIAPDGLSKEPTVVGQRIVPTFAHQIAISRAAQVIDGMELGSFCEKVLKLPAEDVDRALGSIHFKLPAPTTQLLAAQARLRKEKCATTRAALELSGTRPLICITTEQDDPKPYTSLQLHDGSIGDYAPGTNALGEAWEQARNNNGKPLLNDPFIIICNASEKEAFDKTHLAITTVDNMLQATSFAREHCFGGACMAVFVTLPIVNETLLAQMIRFRKAMEIHAHVTVCFLPPPPTRTVHYGEVASFLLKEGGGFYRISSDGGSALQLGRYGTGTDKRYVANGGWTRDGWQLVKVHAIHVAGWLCFQERVRKTSSAPLRQMGKLEMGEPKEKPASSSQIKDRLHPTFAGRTLTQPKDRLHSTLAGRITKPAAAAKPSTSSLTTLLSSILSDAALKASASSSSARARPGSQRSAPSHNSSSTTKKRFSQ